MLIALTTLIQAVMTGWCCCPKAAEKNKLDFSDNHTSELI